MSNRDKCPNCGAVLEINKDSINKDRVFSCIRCNAVFNKAELIIAEKQLDLVKTNNIIHLALCEIINKLDELLKNNSSDIKMVYNSKTEQAELKNIKE